MDWYIGVWRQYAVFTGRARRKEYWMFFLVNLAIVVALDIADAAIGTATALGLRRACRPCMGLPCSSRRSPWPCAGCTTPTRAAGGAHRPGAVRGRHHPARAARPGRHARSEPLRARPEGRRARPVGARHVGAECPCHCRLLGRGRSRHGRLHRGRARCTAGDAPTAPAASPAAGWYPDPTGRHQVRYWDAARWTEHVSDDGVAAVDPL